jgi:hypothetical protein
MAHIKTPWTEEQVRALQIWQYGEILSDGIPDKDEPEILRIPRHPFTCDKRHNCSKHEQYNYGILHPTKDGWICSCAEYTQDWAHDFMFK